MGKIITIHRGNTPSGEYDVHKPLPYPYHVEAETGDVGRQEFWHGTPLRVLGFQQDADIQIVDLSWREAAAVPDRIVGMFPVLLHKSGGIYNETCPITKISVTDDSEVSS